MCEMIMSPAIFVYFFKIVIFWVFQSSSRNAQKEIMMCAPRSSHVCDFSYILVSLKKRSSYGMQ